MQQADIRGKWALNHLPVVDVRQVAAELSDQSQTEF